MKSCPICKRSYHDDTLVFCLQDGSRLTSVSESVREPPETEILPPGRISSNQSSAPLRTTIRAVTPMYTAETPGNDAPENRGANLWIILGGIFVILVVGVAAILGYLAFKTNRRLVAETPVSNSNSQTKTLLTTNTNQIPTNQTVGPKAPDVQSKVPDQTDNLDWLNGVWSGEGYQTDTRTTWRVILTVDDDTYTIEYPNIPCRGTWKLNDRNSRGGSFTEMITQGTQLCTNNSRILVEKLNDAEISCKYSHAGTRTVIATAVLSKKN